MAGRRPGARAYFLITLFAFALVLLPFLFWYQTWFGRRLTDAQLDQYFADKSNLRHAQHALVQLGERLSRRMDISRWRPDVLAAAVSPSVELRQTAAWIMGQDRGYAPFHETLRKLIDDPAPMVRRNAALALAAFGDPAARPELRRMLEPYALAAPAGGILKYRVKEDEYVNPGTLVAHVGTVEVRSPVPGTVRTLDGRDGSTVRAGDPVAELSPEENHAWEALRALYLVGVPDDLELVERFVRPLRGMTAKIQKQAAFTAQEIEARKTAP